MQINQALGAPQQENGVLWKILTKKRGRVSHGRELVRVYRESLPKIRLVGKRYTNQDRDQYGGFGHRVGRMVPEWLFYPHWIS